MPEQATIILRALTGAPLAEPAVRDTVTAAAQALAERTGIALLGLHTEPDRITLTLATDRLAALGFAAELRRATTSWYTKRTGRPTLWGEAAEDPGR